MRVVIAYGHRLVDIKDGPTLHILSIASALFLGAAVVKARENMLVSDDDGNDTSRRQC